MHTPVQDAQINQWTMSQMTSRLYGPDQIYPPPFPHHWVSLEPSLNAVPQRMHPQAPANGNGKNGWRGAMGRLNGMGYWY
jgi:hypothetical protein